ncbi:MAG TPA: hypothetical protein VHE80_04415 [Acidimicrobiales bacterium]|nr:hypothetical protein [Acidimicrobiales bacterium]
MARVVRVLAALVVAAAALTACSGGGDDDGATDSFPTVPEGFGFTVIGADVHAIGAYAPFPPELQRSVLATVNAYLTAGVVQPLQDDKPPAGVEAAFTPVAATRLAGPDRAALVEDGAFARGDLRQERANVRFTAMRGPSGDIVVVTAQLDIALVVETSVGDVAAVRAGEMVLVPDGDGWRIDAFDVVARHHSLEPGQAP